MSRVMTALLAPAPGLISEPLLRSIADVLGSHGIRHNVLVEGAPNLNLNLTDRSRVFVKVTRRGERLDRAFTEVASATWARAHGLLCPTPLMDAPVIVSDETEAPRAVTAWSWVETASAGSLIDRCRDVLGIIEHCAQTPAPDHAKPWNLDFLRQRLRERLGSRPDTISTAVLADAETSGERVAALLAGRDARWAHLDLHLNNVGWCVNSHPVVFDWESSGTAPVEADVSQLLRSIFVDTPDYAPSERLRVAAVVVDTANERMDIDWRLVRALIRFRAASSASHFLTTGERPKDLRRNLDLIESPMGWLPAA